MSSDQSTPSPAAPCSQLVAPLRACLFGAAPDTGNLGVSALWHATLAGIFRRAPAARITVFDDGYRRRMDKVRVGDRDFGYERLGASNSRRFYRPDNLWHLRVAGRLGGCGNVRIQRLAEASAVLDITGGDSFTDLYGARRFRGISHDKLLALEQCGRLILLPQTYGPFQSIKRKRVARQILCRAQMVWARDAHSLAVVQELLGNDFDPARCRLGVDVAFGLEAREPSARSDSLRSWLETPADRRFGVNISGLLHNDPARAAARFGLRADYREVVRGLVHRLLEATDARVLLVPHAGRQHAESDWQACADLWRGLPERARERVAVLGDQLDQCEVKWVIARSAWFCGTRMHATIAALSSVVPVAAIAYSAKTKGVFETCGQGAAVADPRDLATEAVIDALWQTCARRDAVRDDLARTMPSVLARATAQMDAILAAVERTG
jgi:polysaccharide pyruvyl transferase WcaK-like protein